MKKYLVHAVAVLFVILVGGAANYAAGTFRFLTTSLPDGSTNLSYDATLQTANSTSSVTYRVSSGSLPPGVTLNATTGFLSGRPTTVGQYSVTFTATDGEGKNAPSITFATTIKVSAAGGGGNAGISFTTSALTDGKVGTAYSITVTVQDNKSAAIFGASDLPAGLSMNGSTGVISGTPTVAGTFYVTLTATDPGENNNKIIVVLPLTVLPADSSFKFTNTILNNGEVGTAYTQTLSTSGATGAVTFGGTGLPTGLTVDATTGVISGTPTVAGTFLVTLSATNGSTTITLNRTISIAPSATSSFVWIYQGLPSGLLATSYSRQPAVLLVTQNPGPSSGVTYTSTGLPPGMTYDSSSGELAGTPTEAGIFPTKFTATNSANGEQLVFNFDFVILPSNGGDTNNLSINLWIQKQSFKKVGAAKDSWKLQCIYNADRRTGSIFDPSTQTLSVSLGSTLAITLAPTKLSGKVPAFSYKGADVAVLVRTNSTTPSAALKLDESKQTLALATKSETIADTPPGELRHTVVIGNKSFKLDEYFDTKGVFLGTSSYRKTACVSDKAALSVKGAGKDAASISMLLADPSFAYTSGISVLRFRLLNGSTALIDKTFTTLGTGIQSTDSKTGAKVFKLKSAKDTATSTILSKFGYDSKSGKIALAFKALTLTALTDKEAHLTLEFTVGDKVYYTGLTFFAPTTGKYGTALPRK